MIKKFILFHLFLLVIIINTSAQKAINEGFLFYKINSLLTSKSGQVIEKNKMRSIVFNKDYVKSNSVFDGSKVSVSSIFKCENKQMNTYVNNDKEFIYSTNDDEAKVYESMTGYNKSNFKNYILLKGDTIINAINCKKAIAIFEFDGQVFDSVYIYYDPKRKLNINCGENVFDELNGLPLKIIYEERSLLTFNGVAANNSKKFKPTITITLDSISETEQINIERISNIEKYEFVDSNNFMSRMFSIVRPGNNKIVLQNKSSNGEKKITNFTLNNSQAPKNIIMTDDKMTEKTFGSFELNETMKNFEGESINDKKITMDNYKGKVLVINFWFTTCKPCIEELPILNKTLEKFKDNKDVAFLAVTWNDKETVNEFLQKNSFKFNQLINGKDVLKSLGVSLFPQTIIIDKNGIIKFTKVSTFKNDKELEKAIDKILNN